MTSKRKDEAMNHIETEVADEGESDEVPPLTKPGYYRDPDTIKQIRSALPLSREELLARAKIVDKCDPRHFLAEVIVFFIRHHRLDNDERLVSALLAILVARCQPVIRNAVRGFDEATQDDIVQDVLQTLVQKLLVKGSGSDFAQAKFWLFLKRLRLTVCARHSRYLQNTDQLEDEQHGQLLAARDRDLSPEEAAQLAEGREALERLKPHERQAFIMRHYLGMKVGPEDRSKEDPDDPSIAAHFNVSRRTIQNWLTRASEKLAAFKED